MFYCAYNNGGVLCQATHRNRMKREDLYIRMPSKKDGTHEFIKKLGGDPEAVARRAGLEYFSTQTNIRYVPWTNFCRFFELSAQELDDPYFGLKWAMNIPKDLRNIGPAIYMGTIAKNMRHLLAMLTAYLKIYTNAIVFSYEEDVEANTVTGVVELHPLSPPSRQFCEHTLACTAEMGRRHVPDFKLIAVTFQYSAPKDISWYEKAFQCPVYFNADRNTLVTDRVYLGTEKMSPALKLIAPLLKSYIKWSVEKSPNSSQPMSQFVIATLPAIIGVGNSNIEAVATALQLHPKKLQRLLAEEGTSYSELLDRVRESLAERLLMETDISIDRVARTLDYSTARAFTTACKRWFDMTPTKYRDHIRDNSSAPY